MPPLEIRQAAAKFAKEHPDAVIVSAFIAGYEYAQQHPYLDATMVDNTPNYDDMALPVEHPKPSGPTTYVCEFKDGMTKTFVCDFDTLWNLYDRKDNKQSALKAWSKLSIQEKDRAFTHVPAFVKAHPDKKFRPMLATYLNQKRFNDEEIISNGNDNQPTEQEQRFAGYASAINNA